MAAISDYEALLSSYPDRRDNDGLLYQLAKAYVIAGKAMLAITTLERLTGISQIGLLTLKASFAWGNCSMPAATTAKPPNYERLIAKGRDGNDYYVSAGYLLGWTLFKQQQNEASF